MTITPRFTLWAFFVLLTIWSLVFCNTNTSFTPSDTYLNLQDSVNYTGMATCRSCHDNVHQTFIRTGMGRSWHLATRQKSDASFGAQAVVYDTLNDLYYYPFFKNDSSLHVLEYRLNEGDTVHRRVEKISYIVGSGQHTNSHIIDINGYIYQAPVTWYTQEQRWDLAPGFRQNNSRFDRLLTAECITCHNHYPTPVPGSINRFTGMPTGIECERCHGPGELHAKEMLAGNYVDTATSIDYTIVNPRDLPRERQMDLCQRCHLQGVAVTEEGKSFFDFKPGMKLNEVINVFLPRYTDSHEKFIMASQADRLRMSPCFKVADELTCLTCHHPHHSVAVTPKEQYDQACKNCHQPVSCSAPTPEREANGDHCAGCHMPKSGSIDIPHVRITDHFISKQKEKGLSKKPDEKAFLGIKILTKDNPTPLDMAKGYLATYDKYIPSPVMLDSAAYYLELSTANEAIKFPVLIHYLFLRQDYDFIVEYATQAADYHALDAWTAYRTGQAFLEKGNPLQALHFFDQAVEKLPYHLDFFEKKGVALLALKRIREAKIAFEYVLSENPKRPVALCNLGFAYVLTGNLTEGEKLYERAIELDPDYEQALVNKAAVLVLRDKPSSAQDLLERVLRINPDNRQAQEGLRHLQ